MPIFLESTPLPSSVADDFREIGALGIARVVLTKDVGAKGSQLELQVLIAALEVEDVVDHGRPGCAESRDDQGRAGADVGRGHTGPAQPRRTADHGAAPLDCDLSTQPVQLPYVLESVLEDRFRHHAASLRLGHEADVGSL